MTSSAPVSQVADRDKAAEKPMNGGYGVERSGVAISPGDRPVSTQSGAVSTLSAKSKLPLASGLPLAARQTAALQPVHGMYEGVGLRPKQEVSAVHPSINGDAGSGLLTAGREARSSARPFVHQSMDPDSMPTEGSAMLSAGGGMSPMQPGVRLVTSLRSSPAVRDEAFAPAEVASDVVSGAALAPVLMSALGSAIQVKDRAPTVIATSPVTSARDEATAWASASPASGSAIAPGKETSQAWLPAIGLPPASEAPASGAKAQSGETGKSPAVTAPADREAGRRTGSSTTAPPLSSTSAEAGRSAEGVREAAVLPLHSSGVGHPHPESGTAQQSGMEGGHNPLHLLDQVAGQVVSQPVDRVPSRIPADQVPGRVPDAALSLGAPTLATDRGDGDIGRFVRQTPGGVRDLAVGYQDPALGYVELHARSTAGAVHASLVAESAASSATLAGHLDSLSKWMHERHTSVESLSVLTQTSRGGPGVGSGPPQQGYFHYGGQSGQSETAGDSKGQFAGDAETSPVGGRPGAGGPVGEFTGPVRHFPAETGSRFSAIA
jgi:hypothetical protein